jgi:MerR family transcriptional regulator/heat shock protein HspR
MSRPHKSRPSRETVSDRRFERDPSRPCFVISVAAGLVRAHPRTLRIYEDEGLLAPARTPTNIRLYSENDIRRILWIRRLTQERGVNLAGVRLIFELEERLGTRILEALFDDEQAREAGAAAGASRSQTSEPAADGRVAERSDPIAEPTPRPITRIVATRVTTTRSGDSDD